LNNSLAVRFCKYMKNKIGLAQNNGGKI